jgi:hypothetical protein
MPSAISSSRETSPNRGSTIDANQVIPNQQSQEEWRKEYGIDPSKHVRLVKLSHMRYQHKDFDTINTFMKGMAVLLVS